MAMPPYAAVSSYQSSYPEYITAAPVTLPPLTHFNDAHYHGYLPGVDMSAGGPSPYPQMPHVSSSRAAPATTPHPQRHIQYREPRC
jgi:hypothetical protein